MKTTWENDQRTIFWPILGPKVSQKLSLGPYPHLLTHWGRVTHICISKLTFIGSYNCLAPGRRQTIIWTHAGILLIGPMGTNFSETLIRIQTFSFKKCIWEWRPSCLGLNVLKYLQWAFEAMLMWNQWKHFAEMPKDQNFDLFGGQKLGLWCETSGNVLRKYPKTGIGTYFRAQKNWAHIWN